jgi:asparagine synthase (glutamine-hydrolysing)
MTALWVYSGAPDPALDRLLASSLRHRGHLGREAGGGVVGSPAATVGVLLPRPDRRLGGVAAEPCRSLAVGIAGRLQDGTCAAGVLADYLVGGAGAIERLPGEWVVAVRDGNLLTVWRDAAGVRTAYWGRHGGRVVVGVEPKAVLATPGFPRRLDAGAVAQFLAFSFVPGERCTLRDLHELPAGHRLEIDLRSGGVRVVRWFVHEDIEPAEGSPDGHIAAVRQVVDRAVAGRVPNGEPVAAFLSGGLDSSIVASVAASVRRERGESAPTTLSLHFGADLPNELEFARAVATRAGTDHRVLEVRGGQLASMLRSMVWYLDEPIGDPVTVGNFALARFAADVSPWVLNGEGGDPVFGGPKNLPMLLAHWYPTLDGPNAREEQYLATWRRAGEEVNALLHPDLRREVDRERDLLDVFRPYFSAARPVHFLNKLMVANIRLKGAHLILPKVDRMLGAHGLTPLSPLFDIDVLRASLELPPTMKLRWGVEKWVLKRAYDDLLPAEVIARRKSGMRVPVHSWFHGELRREAKTLLSARAVRRAGVFDPRRVRDILDYKTGRDGLRLWMLVTFELWRRMVFEGERFGA